MTGKLNGGSASKPLWHRCNDCTVFGDETGTACPGSKRP